MTEPFPGEEPAPASRPRTARRLYAVGTLLVLVGSVLPWLRAATPIFAWEFSLLWSLSGSLDYVDAPPTAGAVVLVCGLVLAAGFLLLSSVGGPLMAVTAGLVVGVGGLTAFQALTFAEDPVAPHIGLIACVVGAALAGIGALAESGE